MLPEVRPVPNMLRNTMTAVPKVPRVKSTSWKVVIILAPSLTKLGDYQIIKFFRGGGWDCSCPAVYWAKMKSLWNKQCRHYKMCTLRGGEKPVPTLEEALQLLKDKKIPMRNVWDKMNICAMPVNYSISEIHCKKCPLYPVWCNKHVIIFGKRNSRKPMIWKIQTALYNDKRRIATKLLRKYLKLVRAVRNEPRRN